MRELAKKPPMKEKSRMAGAGALRALGTGAPVGAASAEGVEVAFARPGDPTFGGSGGRAPLDTDMVGRDPAIFPSTDAGIPVDTSGSAKRARFATGGEIESCASRLWPVAEVLAVFLPIPLLTFAPTTDRADGAFGFGPASGSLLTDCAGLHIERACLATKCLARSLLVTKDRVGKQSLQNVEPESNAALASETAAVNAAFTSGGVHGYSGSRTSGNLAMEGVAIMGVSGLFRPDAGSPVNTSEGSESTTT